MTTRFKSAVVGLCLSVAGMSACSSSPEVPDQSTENAPSYESAKEGDSSANTAGKADQNEASAHNKGGRPVATGPIAHIDGTPVPAEEFNTQMQKIADAGELPDKVLGQATDQIMKKIVDKALIDQAVADADIQVSDKHLQERIDEIRAQFAKANSKLDKKMGALDDLVAKLGISKQEFRTSVRESLAIEKLLVDRGMAYPTDEEIKSFYDEHKDAFNRPEQIQARHILIKVKPKADEQAWEDAQKEAIKIRKKATAAGADFGAVAKASSDGPSASKGGQLGWISRQKLPFAEDVFDLDNGQVSEPIRSKYGWHIIKKTGHREAGQVEFAKVKPQLESKLRNRRVKQAVQELLDELRANKNIEMHPENVN